MVAMRHPEVEADATATREAFDLLWSKKGWTEVAFEDANIPAVHSEPDYSAERTEDELAESERLTKQAARSTPRSSGSSTSSTSKSSSTKES
jgi:hypothetical protein